MFILSLGDIMSDKKDPNSQSLTDKDIKEINKILGSNIKKARKEKKLTQKELADKMDVSVITIQQWEKGAYVPRTDKMIKLAKVLGYFGVDLYEGIENFIPHEITYSSQKELNNLMDFKNKLYSLHNGYKLIPYLDERGDPWLFLEYPDGVLDVSNIELEKIDQETDEYLVFKLEQLKKKKINNFHKKK